MSTVAVPRISGPLPLTRSPRRRGHLGDILTLASVALWAEALSQTRVAGMDTYGLVSVLPVTYFAALLTLTLSFTLALRAERVSTLRMTAHVVLLVLFIHGTVPLLFAEPHYTWVYRHFGVVGYINAHGAVSQSVDIYQNWPGFFALVAWFSRASGLGDPVRFAAWAQVYFNLLFALGIRLRRQRTHPVGSEALACRVLVRRRELGCVGLPCAAGVRVLLEPGHIRHRAAVVGNRVGGTVVATNRGSGPAAGPEPRPRAVHGRLVDTSQRGRPGMGAGHGLRLVLRDGGQPSTVAVHGARHPRPPHDRRPRATALVGARPRRDCARVPGSPFPVRQQHLRAARQHRTSVPQRLPPYGARTGICRTKLHRRRRSASQHRHLGPCRCRDRPAVAGRSADGAPPAARRVAGGARLGAELRRRGDLPRVPVRPAVVLLPRRGGDCPPR